MPLRHQYNQMLEEINRDVLRMGSLVEQTIERTIDALIHDDRESAAQIIADDQITDDMERDIEDKCVRLLATQTPVARDLRFIFAINKIAKDIERIGDLSVSIARQIKNQRQYLSDLVPAAIPVMAGQIIGMLHDCLDAFVRVDVSLARDVHKRDDQVDEYFINVLRELLKMLTCDGSQATVVVPILFIDRYLERMADHITNICEWIVYFATGERLEEHPEKKRLSWHHVLCIQVSLARETKPDNL